MRHPMILLFMLLAVSGLTAQDGSRYQRPDYLKQLPPAELRPGLGTSHMAIATSSEIGQQYFDQGLSLMHDFWFFEAYRSFAEAVRLDSSAALAYWGVARALNGFTEFHKERELAVARLTVLRDSVSDRDRRYIDAFFARDTLAGKEAKAEEQRLLEQLIASYPDEIEAKLILVRSLGYRKPYARALLGELLASHPDNQGAHHYWIHSWERDDPLKAAASAERLAALAPAAGHIQHMPGHLFFDLGRYDDAVEAFLRSDRVESAYLDDFDIHPVDNGMAIHNRYYLVVALAESGRYREAVDWAERVAAVRAPKGRNGAEGGFAMFYQGYLVPGKMELRFGHWREAAAWFDRMPPLEPVLANGALSADVTAGAWRSYAHGMAEAADGNVAAAEVHATELEALLWRSKADESLEIYGGWLERRLALAALELRGAIASAAGDHQEALEILERAVTAAEAIPRSEPPFYPRLVHESYATALGHAGQWTEAAAVYHDALEHRPDSGFLLYGLARAHDMAGNAPEAIEWYRAFLQAWQSADADLPQVVLARQRVDRAVELRQD